MSSPSGEAAEDNVEERENSEVTQFFGYGLQVTGYVRKDGRTDIRTDGCMDRETWKLKYYFRSSNLIFNINNKSTAYARQPEGAYFHTKPTIKCYHLNPRKRLNYFLNYAKNYLSLKF